MERRGEITRANGQGGYTIFGRLLELRYTRTNDHPPIAPMMQEFFDRQGCVLDWMNPQSGPLLARTRNDELIVIGQVPELPEKPDLGFLLDTFVVYNENKIPLASIPPDMRKGLKNSDGTPVPGTDQALRKPRMIKQRFADHCRGAMGNFMVFSPLTEGLVKLAGISALPKIYFHANGASQPGFFLDPATGEGHFCGGRITFSL